VKLTIACIGRAARGPERDLYDHYANRIRWPLALRELEEKKKLPPAELVRREGELLLGAVPDKSVLVALDRRGKVLDSEAFARRLERWRDDGALNAHLRGATLRQFRLGLRRLQVRTSWVRRYEVAQTSDLLLPALE